MFYRYCRSHSSIFLIKWWICLHTYRNVPLDIRKLDIQSLSVNALCSNHSQLLSLAHELLFTVQQLKSKIEREKEKTRHRQDCSATNTLLLLRWAVILFFVSTRLWQWLFSMFNAISDMHMHTAALVSACRMPSIVLRCFAVCFVVTNDNALFSSY